LGSIAPDAIQIREHTTRQDKGKIHLCKEDGTLPGLQVFNDFCKEHLNKDDHGYNQFILGYVSHIYTDLRWTETVWADFVDTQYSERIVKNLRDDKNEPHIMPIYITDEIVSMFINTTVEELRDLIYVYHGGNYEKMDRSPPSRRPMSR
jgi:hypothetical protein